MLKELEWFISEAAKHQDPGSSPGEHKEGRKFSLNLANQHFEMQRHAAGTAAEALIAMQDVLRILKLHDIAINILAAVAKDSASAKKMMPALYGFLRQFCAKNPKNQAALYTPKSLQLIVQQIPEDMVRGAVAPSPLRN